ncbi:unnamed protein product [Blepharisma stoltei]|uniref:Uncharacterized protein n=1 Tax=Blepharisma stoltei TaxID=1481888 RepID=A0AAU9JTC6_9CILI|nr:unnamed protein product [Blepharisma stoltei]
MTKNKTSSCPGNAEISENVRQGLSFWLFKAPTQILPTISDSSFCETPLKIYLSKFLVNGDRDEKRELYISMILGVGKNIKARRHTKGNYVAVWWCTGDLY